MPKTYMIYMAAVWLSCFFSLTGCADVNPDEIRDADTEIIYRMKDIAAVYAALEGKTAKGQSADIEDLAPLAELLKDG